MAAGIGSGRIKIRVEPYAALGIPTILSDKFKDSVTQSWFFCRGIQQNAYSPKFQPNVTAGFLPIRCQGLRVLLSSPQGPKSVEFCHPKNPGKRYIYINCPHLCLIHPEIVVSWFGCHNFEQSWMKALLHHAAVQWMAPIDITNCKRKIQRRSWLRLIISTVLVESGFLFPTGLSKNKSSTLFLPPSFHMQFSDTLSVGLHGLHKAQAALLRLTGPFLTSILGSICHCWAFFGC